LETGYTRIAAAFRVSVNLDFQSKLFKLSDINECNLPGRLVVSCY
jgi:hypothetical protein